MKYIHLISTLILLFSYTLLFSQTDSTKKVYRNCGSVKYNAILEAQNRNFKNRRVDFEKILNHKIQQRKQQRIALSTTIIRIPVVVHVIHNSKAGTIGGINNANISDEQILSQIEVLNEDFRKLQGTLGYNNDPVGADTKIEFCLASTDPNCKPTTGITRHYSSKSSFDMDYDDGSIKSFGYWPSDQYLNIWVCNLAKDVLGYAQFPNYTGLEGLDPYEGESITDGVVINHKVFGRNIGTATSSLYRYGRTATHEIGHWLGLKHIWGDANCGDDYCNDTPPQDNPSSSDDSCPFQGNSCGGNFHQNMFENYMDYSADACMNIFTNDQNLRMQTVLNISPNRLKLFQSIGCSETKLISPPQLIDFDFNEDTYWKTSSSDDTIKWTKTFNNSTVFMCNNTLSKSKSFAIWESPYFEFKNSESPILLFDLAYPNIANNVTDTLEISYSNTCKNDNFTILDILTGEELITSNQDANGFSPNTGDWKKIKYNLSQFKNYPITRFRFRSISNQKATIFLDNVHIYSPITNSYVDENNNIYLDRIGLIENETATIKIYDCAGKLINTLYVPNNKLEKFEYSLDFLPMGMYIAALETKSHSSKTKFIIKH